MRGHTDIPPRMMEAAEQFEADLAALTPEARLKLVNGMLAFFQVTILNLLNETDGL